MIDHRIAEVVADKAQLLFAPVLECQLGNVFQIEEIANRAADGIQMHSECQFFALAKVAGFDIAQFFQMVFARTLFRYSQSCFHFGFLDGFKNPSVSADDFGTDTQPVHQLRQEDGRFHIIIGNLDNAAVDAYFPAGLKPPPAFEQVAVEFDGAYHCRCKFVGHNLLLCFRFHFGMDVLPS